MSAADRSCQKKRAPRSRPSTAPTRGVVQISVSLSIDLHRRGHDQPVDARGREVAVGEVVGGGDSRAQLREQAAGDVLHVHAQTVRLQAAGGARDAGRQQLQTWPQAAAPAANRSSLNPRPPASVCVTGSVASPAISREKCPTRPLAKRRPRPVAWGAMPSPREGPRPTDHFDLFGPYPRVFGGVDDDGRLEKVALAELLAGGRGPGDHLAATLYGVGELRFDLRALSGGMQGSHLGRRVDSAAQLEASGARADFVDELFGDAVEHVDALDRQAGLAGVEEASDGDHARRLIEVGVVADDGGVAIRPVRG